MAATKHAQQIKKDSQNYLTEALFQLLAIKPLHEIKVTELVERAGVSRMAFYRNFDSIENLLQQYFAPQIKVMFDNVIFQQSTEVKRAELENFFNHFQIEFKLAPKRSYEYIIRDLFTKNMSRYYAQWDGLDSIKLQYWVVFMTNGVYGIWRKWLLDDCKESLTEIHSLIKILQETTEAALKKA